MSDKRDFCAIGLQYAQDVVSGKIPNGRFAIAACARSLRDRADQSTLRFPFTFDETRANKVCQFISLLPNLKGPQGGKPIYLEPWQCFLLCETFGWIHSSGIRQGMRRFRRVYVAVPRGNGKSTLSSAVAIFMLSADSEQGAEVYSAATTQSQARITFGDAQAMARHQTTKKLMDHLGIAVHAHSISVLKTHSKFSALSAEASSLDGLNIHFGLLDELHANRDRSVFDVLTTGAGKRPQSIMWSITTAGSDRSGICYEVQTYCQKILEQVVDDESQFAAIWHADETDDWRSIDTFTKANPNWGISVDPSYVEGEMRKAESTPSAQNNLKTKHLNIWVSNDSPWLDMNTWNNCADTTLQLEDFEGKECFIGLDLASVSDIAAKTYLFPDVIDGEIHYTVFGKYYLSEAAINDSRNASYNGWQIDGYLTVTEGDVTDFGQIEAELEDDLKRFNVREIGFDPWQAMTIAQNLQKSDANMVEVRPNVANFSAPMKAVERMVKQNRLHHDGNPALAWMASNVVCHYDFKDNVFPKKERPENKIDGIVSLITALARAMIYEDARPEPRITIFG